MATLNAVIVPAKALKGGRHKVRISVSHNGDFRYLVTDIIIDSTSQFKNGRVVKRPDASALNMKIGALLNKYQAAIDSMDYIDGFSCAELVQAIKGAQQCSRRYLSSVIDEYISASNGVESSKRAYRKIKRTLLASVNGDIAMDNIRHSTLIAIDRHFRAKGNNDTTIATKMSFLISVINYAVRCGYVTYKVDPTLGYRRPHPQIRNSWLTTDQVRAIRDTTPKKRAEKRARDLFMLSYCLGGINMADLRNVAFDRKNNVLKYARQKTIARNKPNKYVEFEIPEEAWQYIDRLTGKDGRLAISDAQRAKCCNQELSHPLKAVGKAAGVEGLIYYSARKSFAQHAFNLGVSESVIDYILGHGSNKGSTCLFVYMGVTPAMATDAVRRVMDDLNKDLHN